MKPLVTDGLWAVVAPLLPRRRAQPKGGRPWIDDRATLNGVLYVLRDTDRSSDRAESDLYLQIYASFRISRNLLPAGAPKAPPVSPKSVKLQKSPGQPDDDAGGSSHVAESVHDVPGIAEAVRGDPGRRSKPDPSTSKQIGK